MDDDDVRQMELESLEAIYPEIHRTEKDADAGEGSLAFQLELAVQPDGPVTVTFPAPAAGIDAAGIAGQHQRELGNGPAEEDSLQVSHLPPLFLRMSLVEGYPETLPPRVSLSTNPEWLTRETLNRLEADAHRLWGEMAHDLVAYAYIDHLQRSADDVFGTVGTDGTLQVDPQHKLAVLDYDIKAKKTAFEKETFDCGICLDPKKGSKCHKMLECGHIFCLECLQDFYNDAIEEGSVNTVRCLEPSCAKQRATASEKEGKKSKKPRTAISPSELLDIGVPEDKVKRYVMLKYKNELESDKSTIYCPRPWCGGAARSEKHKKPLGLDFAETSSDDGESDDTDAEEGNDGRRGGDKAEKSKASDRSKQPAELLAVCEDCHFAFCSRCMQTWHGEFYQCTPKATREELTEQEKASLEYLNLYTSPCPTCECRAQKTHGCNHMICPRCQTHFCYLCSEWLNPANPYAHYNPDSASPYPQGQHVSTKCHGRLWELEDGQGDNLLPLQARPDARARPQEPGQQQQQQQDLHEGHDEDGQDANHLRGLLQGGGGAGGAAGDGGEDGAGQILGYHGDGENPQRRAGMFQVNGNDNVAERNVVVVAREAPLVLRLMGNDGQARHGNGHHDNDNRNGHGNNNARGRGQGGRGARGGGPNAHQRRRPPVADAGEDQPDAAGADANAGRGGGAVRGFGNNMNNNRGRGRRGRGAGGGVRAGRARGAAGAGRGGAGGGGIRGGPAVGLAAGQGRDEAGQGRQEWGAAQEEWVARFVQMALVDIEDELDDDWDFEDEGLFLIN